MSINKEEFSCYKCIYRGTVPGDRHSACHHPNIENDLGVLMSLIVGRAPDKIRELDIRADPWGVANGWFMWPVNFDPMWLRNCNGYTIEKPSPENTVSLPLENEK